MFRKVNTGILLAVFVGLLAIVVIIQLRKPQTEKTIDKDVFVFDTAQIGQITIAAEEEGRSDIELDKKAGKWYVIQKDEEYIADQQKIQHLLNTISGLAPKRLAAKNADKWDEYQVTDSLGVRVTLEEGNNTTGFIIGKFSYEQPQGQSPYQQQQQGIMNTYVRPFNKTEVYVVDGFLRMTFGTEISQYRIKTIINSDKENWTRLTFSYPADSSFLLEKTNNQWMMNGVPVDSNAVTSYFGKIEKLKSTHFLDEDKYQAANATHALKIEGNNMLEPIIIQAVPADSTHQYAIHSSMNEEAWFSGKKAGLFKKLFIGIGALAGK